MCWTGLGEKPGADAGIDGAYHLGGITDIMHGYSSWLTFKGSHLFTVYVMRSREPAATRDNPTSKTGRGRRVPGLGVAFGRTPTGRVCYRPAV